MIKLKLKELLDSHSLTISEFSSDTGLARSTITPMVNKPNEVKALKLETINVICDYFGINTDELIEFLPETKKYSVISTLKVKNRDAAIIVLKKQLGNTERLCMIYANVDLVPLYFDNETQETTTRFKIDCELSVLDKENIPEYLSKKYASSNIISSDIFLKDFKRTDKDIQRITTEIIAYFTLDVAVSKTELKQASYADFIWTDFPFFERMKFSFEIEVDINDSFNLISTFDLN